MTASQDASASQKLPASAKSNAKSKKSEKSEEEIALDSLMAEVEEDLRSEELSKLWKKYGAYVVAVVSVIVASVVGWQLWRQYQENQLVALTKQYESATKLVQEGKLDDALNVYAAVAEKKGQGLAALAQLQKAAITQEKNDLPGALAAYKALENDGSADPIFRDLATVLYALHGLDTENPLQLEAGLKPLLDPANPFSYSATELTALLAAKQGDAARAAQLAESLAADAKAPQGIRQRAEELAGVLKSSTAAPPAEPAAPAAEPK